MILYTSPAGREYGLVTLPDGTSLVEVLVNEGVVKVRDDAGKHSEQAGHEPLIEMLRIYEEQAKDAQKGTWNQEDDGLIDSTFESPSNPQEFLEEHKGRPIDGEDIRPSLFFKVLMWR